MDEEDLVPLVLTYDAEGNPKRTRMIPRERYRRLHVFEDYNRPEDAFGEETPVNGASFESFSDDPTDRGWRLYIDPDTSTEARNEPPEEFDGVPLVYGGREEPEMNFK